MSMCRSRNENEDIERTASIVRNLVGINESIELLRKSLQIISSLKEASNAGLVSDALKSSLLEEEARNETYFKTLMAQLIPLRKDLKQVESLCLVFSKNLKKLEKNGYKNLLAEKKLAHVMILLKNVSYINSQFSGETIFDVPDLIVSFMNNIKLLTAGDNEFCKAIFQREGGFFGFFRRDLYRLEKNYIADLNKLSRSYPESKNFSPDSGSVPSIDRPGASN